MYIILNYCEHYYKQFSENPTKFDGKKREQNNNLFTSQNITRTVQQLHFCGKSGHIILATYKSVKYHNILIIKIGHH